jgi:phage baseplate assembly protein W
MAVQRISRSFKDISLSFVPHPVTKDLPILKNERAISRSIRNLVETIPTERFFNSLLGSDVYRSLFEFCDYGTASIIQTQIETTIENYEPRASIRNIKVKALPDYNSVSVYVEFLIVNTEELVSFETTISRLR